MQQKWYVTNSSEIEYWEKERERVMINKNVSDMLTEVFEQVAEKGIKNVVTKKNLKKLYKQYCEQ